MPALARTNIAHHRSRARAANVNPQTIRCLAAFHSRCPPRRRVIHVDSHHSAAPAGHDAHAGHSVAMFRRKFWIALILTIPAAIWGEMFAHVWGVSPPAFPGSRFIPLVFGTAAFAYSVAVTFGARGASLWWELSSLVTIMLLGHWMEMRSISRAQGALTELV